MKRVFQHYSGAVEKIVGLKAATLKVLVDESDQDVILLWLETETDWFRIFIDGVYCGIDQYTSDKSEDDLDDGVFLLNRADWVSKQIITRAYVETRGLPLIDLTICFSNRSQLILRCHKNEQCSLSRKLI
ncbi:hypothetical protein N8482_00840 [Chitinophagales bacterium]|nr:hypothetical protein [Chitinophagales bacterium]